MSGPSTVETQRDTLSSLLRRMAKRLTIERRFRKALYREYDEMRFELATARNGWWRADQARDAAFARVGELETGRAADEALVAKAEQLGDEVGRADRSDAVETAARVMVEHYYWSADDGTRFCQCGWKLDESVDAEWRELMTRHVAEQLAAAGALDLRPVVPFTEKAAT